MFNRDMFIRMREISRDERFIRLIQPSDRSSKTQAGLDFLTRYIVFVFVEYDKSWDIEEYLDNGIVELSNDPPGVVNNVLNDFVETLELIDSIKEPNILKRYKDGKFTGKVGQAAFETIFLGVSFNLSALKSNTSSKSFILRRAKELWQREDVQNFTKAGLRGTDRIQRTIPFGRQWFKP